MSWADLFDDEWADAALHNEIERRTEARVAKLLEVAPVLNPAILVQITELAQCEVLFETAEDWLVVPSVLVQRARRKFWSRSRSLVSRGVTPDWKGLAKFVLDEEIDRVA